MIYRTFTLLIFLSTITIDGFTQTVVDRCSSDTEPGGTKNLARALIEGGHIVFNCPPGTEIRMTTGHTIAPDTTIDGEGKVTLDAHGLPMTMFRVPKGSFAVERLTIRNVAKIRSSIPGNQYSVLDSSGNVSLVNVSIIASESPVRIHGNARIINSEFLENSGWALSIRGNADVDRSRFIGNDVGLSLGSGWVHDSLFSQNKNYALRIIYPKGGVSVVKSHFTRNTGKGAIVLSQRSSRESGTSVISIKRSKFTDNVNTHGGGAITIYDSTVDSPQSVQGILRTYPPAKFEFAYNSFIGNRGRNGGAINADLHETGGLIITGGIFVSNVADGAGGAIAWVGRSILITHSLFRANQGQKGGALFADYRETGSRWIVANSLFAENTVAANGGAIESGPVELFNVTIARNTGFGFVADVHGSPPNLPIVVNTIISENSEGNCRGIAYTGFKGANLQFGHRDCPEVKVENPYLDSLYVPSLGSPALSSGDVAFCRAAPVSRKDIIFQSRGTDDRCSLGAFERPPVRRIPLRNEARG